MSLLFILLGCVKSPQESGEQRIEAVKGGPKKNYSLVITSPINLSSFTSPASLTLEAAVNAGPGVSEVIFFLNGLSVGSAYSSPFRLPVKGLVAGLYSVYAVAYSKSASPVTSETVLFNVSGSANNAAPSVAITSPANNASYAAPATFNLSASASDADGSISEVAFYQGSVLLVEDKSAPYERTVSNLAAGTYTFTAVAKDNLGATQTALVRVVVTAPSTNPTNTPNLAVNLALETGALISGSVSAGSGRGTPLDIVYNPQTGAYATNTQWAEYGVAYSQDLGKVTESNAFYWMAQFSTAKFVDYITFGGTYSNQPQANTMWKVQYRDSGDWVTLKAGMGGWINSGILELRLSTPVIARAVRVIAYSDGVNSLSSIHLRGRGGPNDSSLIKGTLIQYRGNINIGPEVQLTSPSNNASFDAPASFILSANASDADGSISEVEFHREGAVLPLSRDAIPPYSHVVSNLPAGSYTFTAIAIDNLGARKTSNPISVIVRAVVPDTEKPSVPSELASPYKTDRAITLSWKASTDNVKVAGYQIYRGNPAVKVGDVVDTTFSDLDLTPETTYIYSVLAYDAAGNFSDKSSSINVKTMAAGSGVPICQASSGKCYYVDNAVAVSGYGTTWAKAWKTFTAIAWPAIRPGDVIYISGGAVSKSYDEKWSVKASGVEGNPIQIRVGQDPGHNGVVNFDYDSLGDLAEGSAIGLSGNFISISGNVLGKKHLRITNFRNIMKGEEATAIVGHSRKGITVEFLEVNNVNIGVKIPVVDGITIRHNDFIGMRGNAVIRIID